MQRKFQNLVKYDSHKLNTLKNVHFSQLMVN